jgi:hypothetical protein
MLQLFFKLSGWPVEENIKYKNLACFYENTYDSYRKPYHNSSPAYYFCHWVGFLYVIMHLSLTGEKSAYIDMSLQHNF